MYLNNGFSLIECLIYITCTILLIGLFSTLVSKLYLNTNNIMIKSQQYIENIIGVDSFLSDLRYGSEFKKKSNSSLVFKNNNFETKQETNWHLIPSKLGNLYKSFRKWDPENKRWLKKHRNLALQNVIDFNFTISSNFSSKNIRTYIKLKNFEFSSYTALRVGSVL